MRLRRTALTGVAAVATMLALAACGDDDGGNGGDDGSAGGDCEAPSDLAEGSTMATLSEAGSIKIGTKFDQPLFGLRGPSGEPEGFDVEIGKIIACELGIADGDIEWIETVSENRESYIEGGNVDIVVATYTINDERKEVVDFAGPYFNAQQMIMVRADEEEIQSVDDLAGKSACSVEGSTPAANMAENYPDVKMELFAGYADCLEPLTNGQVDALTTDNVILSGYVSESPDDFKLAGEGFTEEPYGIGLKKGDDDFRTFINDALEASYEDGRWEDAFSSTAGEVLETPEPPEVDRY